MIGSHCQLQFSGHMMANLCNLFLCFSSARSYRTRQWGGPLNRSLKIWISASDEGWLLSSDAESLEFKSSDSQSEEAFFNQVVALLQAGLLILANAKRNAIYVIHLEYGPNPAATRLDYIAEFTVTMPILSFTGTSDLLPHDEQVVQVYCVQTQAIQKYALYLCHPLCRMYPLRNQTPVSHRMLQKVKGLLVWSFLA